MKISLINHTVDLIFYPILKILKLKNILFIAFLISSCEKQAGEGGTSSIQGSVYKLSTYFNVLTQQIDTISYQLDSKKDVYIIYSDDENDFYDDNVETNWNVSIVLII